MKDEISKLKTVKEKYCPDKSLQIKEDKEKKDTLISALKKEIVERDQTIKILNKKYNEIEAEVNENKNAIKQLEKVAGEMFNDLRELKAPYFSKVKKDENEDTQKKTKHVTLSENK